MQQVPADRVIAELATRIGELSRELAILKVQVQLYGEAATTTPDSTAPAATATTPAPNLGV